MANITPVQVTADGAAAYTAAAASGGGDTVINATTNTSLIVVNGGGSSITITFTGVTASNHGVVDNPTRTVAAGKTQIIPIPDYVINSSSQVAVAYSAVTSVTVGAIKD